MSKLRRYAGPILALHIATGCSAEPAYQSSGPEQRQEQQRPRLVLAFGDSLYAGYGMSQAQSFPAALERHLEERGIEAEVVNAGVSGDTTAGGRRRLAQTLDQLPAAPDLVILGLGANDFLLGIPPQEMRRNLDAMLAELKRREIPVLMTGLIAPAQFRHPFVAQYEKVIPELARQYGAELEPSLLEGILTRREYLLHDGVHPNPRGTELMAQRVAPLAAGVLE